MTVRRTSPIQRLLQRTMQAAQRRLLQDSSRHAAEMTRVELHIDDVQHGHAERSEDVRQALLQSHRETTSMLGERHAGALKDYVGRLATMSYGQQARFVSAMGRLRDDVAAIEHAVSDAEAFESSLRDMFSAEEDDASAGTSPT